MVWANLTHSKYFLWHLASLLGRAKKKIVIPAPPGVAVHQVSVLPFLCSYIGSCILFFPRFSTEFVLEGLFLIIFQILSTFFFFWDLTPILKSGSEMYCPCGDKV